MIDAKLLEILACPACREAVYQEQEEIVCTGCGRRYPIREEIPIMLLEEAKLPPGTEAEKPEGSS